MVFKRVHHGPVDGTDEEAWDSPESRACSSWAAPGRMPWNAPGCTYPIMVTW